MNDFYYDAMDVDLEYMRTELHDVEEMLKDPDLPEWSREYYEFKAGELRRRLGY